MVHANCKSKLLFQQFEEKPKQQHYYLYYVEICKLTSDLNESADSFIEYVIEEHFAI
jgi:hypothetical protein